LLFSAKFGLTVGSYLAQNLGWQWVT